MSVIFFVFKNGHRRFTKTNVSDVSDSFQLPTIDASSNREAERRRKEQMIAADDFRLPHLNSVNFLK